MGSLGDSGHRMIDMQASNSADEFRIANKTIRIDAFEMLSNNGRNGGGSRKDFHDSGIRTLVAILQPGESESLYIHRSKYVGTLCMYNNTY